jgi:hypothetical protein
MKFVFGLNVIIVANAGHLVLRPVVSFIEAGGTVQTVATMGLDQVINLV